ncbi:MAG: methyltransferase domain-containing protein, partial [Gammaproteobacteria bacterium]|nr:methyltransferase domain-containing protein [Gammaproteobacteria bacterium]
IKWVQGYAEDISIEDYKNFNLVTIANAFHWMDQPIVISKILRLLDSQGYLVLVRSYADITSNASDWQKALNDILESWVGEERKATVGSKYEQINWVEMLNAFPFSSVLTHEIPETRIWSIEDLLGFYFTVSFCSEEKLGEYVEDYKKNVEKTLLKIHPDNKFVQKHNITLIIAKK